MCYLQVYTQSSVAYYISRSNIVSEAFANEKIHISCISAIPFTNTILPCASLFLSLSHGFCHLSFSSKEKLGKAVTKLNTTYLNLRLASLSILLIVLCNPSILNTGPTKLNGIKCYFQNVQGLDIFSSLGKPFPNLNQTKICELQAHILETSPDIVILNETGLKPTIKSNEILPTKNKIYKVFRLDRPIKSHPPDPDNPQKFRTNGGGVLIGVKESLSLKPKLVDQTCCAEVLSIQLSLPNKKKNCLSSVYRVGTLGIKSSISYKNISVQSQRPINLNPPMSLVILTSIPLTGILTHHQILLIHTFLIFLMILASLNWFKLRLTNIIIY